MTLREIINPWGALRALAHALSAEEFSGRADLFGKTQLALARLHNFRNYNFQKRQKIMTLENDLIQVTAERDALIAAKKAAKDKEIATKRAQKLARDPILAKAAELAGGEG